MKKNYLFLLCAYAVAAIFSVHAQERMYNSSEEGTVRIRRELSDLETLNTIGEAFYFGKPGFTESKQYAAFWFRLLAAQNYDAGLYNLGVCYRLGEGVAQSKDSATYCFYMAACEGLPLAQYNLALCYYLGEGVKQDSAEAVYWYKKALRGGSGIPDLSTVISRSEGNTDALYKEIVIQEKPNLGLAFPWIQNAIGESFYRGVPGFPQDMDLAIYWFREAAERQYAQAQSNLGYCFFFGDGVTQSKDSAVYWFRRAAEKGLGAAQCNLALCYFFGDGVEKNNEQVVYWYKQAALQNLPLACTNLGYCYELGIGTPQNTALAEKYYKKAAKKGYAKAQFNLAALYYGEEKASIRKKSLEWLEKAARQDFQPAVKALAAFEAGILDSIPASSERGLTRREVK